ncbi:MAG: hypothetical protein KC731_32155, partial [Myxococcales bacterium]|nr:hypothetical protein [Myxococcales bacterium]
MALLKSRPKIAVLLPRQCFPEQRVTVQVELDANKPVPVDFVDCLVTGTETVGWQSGKYGAKRVQSLFRLGARLREEGELRPGKTRLDCVVDLPAQLPPSYTSGAGYNRTDVEYLVEVHCSIPWWPDAKSRFILPVRLPPGESPPPEARLFSTGVDGPAAGEPLVEFSLDRRHVTPGGKLAGQLAVYNVAYNRYKKAVLSLVAKEKRFPADNRFYGPYDTARLAIEVDLTNATEGESIPFAMRLPEGLVPTLRSQLWS